MPKAPQRDARSIVTITESPYYGALAIDALTTWQSTSPAAIFDNQSYTNYVNGSLSFLGSDSQIKLGGLTISGAIGFGNSLGFLSAGSLELQRSGTITFGGYDDIIISHDASIAGKIFLGSGSDALATDRSFYSSGVIDFGPGGDVMSIVSGTNDGKLIFGLDTDSDSDRIQASISFEFSPDLIYGNLSDDFTGDLNGLPIPGPLLINNGTIVMGGGGDYITGVVNNGTILMGSGDDEVVCPSSPGNGFWDGGIGTDTLRLPDGTYSATQARKGLVINGSTFAGFEKISSSPPLFSDQVTPVPILEFLAGTYVITDNGASIIYSA